MEQAGKCPPGLQTTSPLYYAGRRFFVSMHRPSDLPQQPAAPSAPLDRFERRVAAHLSGVIFVLMALSVVPVSSTGTMDRVVHALEGREFNRPDPTSASSMLSAQVTHPAAVVEATLEPTERGYQALRIAIHHEEEPVFSVILYDHEEQVVGRGTTQDGKLLFRALYERHMLPAAAVVVTASGRKVGDLRWK